jgi:signal transduction histidine kinase
MMSSWIYERAEEWAVSLDLIVGGLAALALIFALLWLRSAVLHRRQARARREAVQAQREGELALAEQSARMRIIRELHTVAIPSMSMMISQARSVRYSGEVDPDAAIRSAAVIEDAAESTLADLRRVMTVIGDAHVDEPTAGTLDGIQELLADQRRKGLTVAFNETGERFELAPGAELTVMSILREALQNARTHGGQGTEAAVGLTWTNDSLRLSVDDDGARAAVRREGRDPNRLARERSYSLDDNLSALTEQVRGPGMTEMRERAELFGGVFTAGAVQGVGFSVSAVFPAIR